LSQNSLLTGCALTQRWPPHAADHRRRYQRPHILQTTTTVPFRVLSRTSRSLCGRGRVATSSATAPSAVHQQSTSARSHPCSRPHRLYSETHHTNHLTPPINALKRFLGALGGAWGPPHAEITSLCSPSLTQIPTGTSLRALNDHFHMSLAPVAGDT
jgi:hypothetical protein